MRYIIYCDESASKGRYFSNFYGGALIEASRKEGLEAVLASARGAGTGELKWTKIGRHNEAKYVRFVDAFFDLVAAGFVKCRIMFTQNIHQLDRNDVDPDKSFFMLYYQFLKHAFGLRYCNPGAARNISVAVYLDDAPDTKEKLNAFRGYLGALSDQVEFRVARVRIAAEDIAEVRSHDHLILQAVDIVLGAMQFRLNDFHKAIPVGQRRRGRRTRAKERVYRHINARVRALYPGFNVGTTTGQANGPEDRWSHPYRHWCFVPKRSRLDLSRGKRGTKKPPPRPT